MEHFSIDGVWWRPSHDERKVRGTLTLDDSGIELVLYDSLRSYEERLGEDAVAPDWETVPLVHGRTNDRRDVTLIESVGFNLAAPFGEVREVYHVEVALVGVNAPDDSFTTTSVRFDFLDAWADPPALRTDDTAGVTLDTARHVLGESNIPVGHVALVSDIDGRAGELEVHLLRTTLFEVTLREALGASTILESVVRPLSDLLAVTLGRPIRVTSWHLRMPDHDDRLPSADASFAAIESGRPSDVSRAAVLAYSAPTLLTLGDGGPPFNELIRRWFEVWETFHSTIVQLIAPTNAPFVFSEHRFASTFQAAEALHRTSTRFTGKELPRTRHRQRVTTIVDALENADIPAEDCEWAKRILESRNDRPLWMVIEDLLKAAGRLGDLALEAAPDFCHTVAGARTGVSHGGAHPILDAPSRLWYGESLRWIVRAHLLIELGLSLDDVERRVDRKASFRHVLSEVATHAQRPAETDDD